MSFNPAVDTIKSVLKGKLEKLEEFLDADVINYYGPIVSGIESVFLDLIEGLQGDTKGDTIYIVLTTGGGSATAVERCVNIVRQHYKEVNFIVPDFAYSAGTIFCMSGDNIHMDYFSVLGPIDPQIENKEGKLVAALGYLDKVEEMIEKAKNNELTHAEFAILKGFDLAELKGFEQAKELTISLLKKWLVKYKFKNWNEHNTNPDLLGQPVTEEEKEERAKVIADQLSDNNLWKSHGRPINIETLTTELRLKIEDYSEKEGFKNLIRDYYKFVKDYQRIANFQIFLQSRHHV